MAIFDKDVPAAKGFAEWLIGPYGALISRVLIALICLIGSLCGYIVTTGVSDIKGSIGSLRTEVSAIAGHMVEVDKNQATGKQRNDAQDALLTVHGTEIRTLQGQVYDLNGSVATIKAQKQ